MNPLLEAFLSNLAVAGLLACVAAAAGLWGRRPALTHGLWLLVLLKLLTPPLFRVPLPWLPPDETAAEAAAPDLRGLPDLQAVEHPPFAMIEPPPDVVPARDPGVPLEEQEAPPPAAVPVAEGPPVAAAVLVLADARDALPPDVSGPSAPEWSVVLGLVWISGTLGWLALVVGRLTRFQRITRLAEAAPAEVQALADDLAGRLGVSAPAVKVLPGPVSPMLWPVGREPLLLLPSGLLSRIPDDQLATLLAHELAHWRRRDHWVRWLEVVVLAVYWWCPLAWWACRELRQAEEECCDAWVVALLPDAARAYALALVETVDFLSGAPAPLPPVASGVGHVRLLRRRLTMILRGTTPRALTLTGTLLVAGAAALFLPFLPVLAQAPPAKRVEGERERERERDRRGEAEREVDEALREVGRRHADDERKMGDRMKALVDELRAVEERMQHERRSMEERVKELRKAAEKLREKAAEEAGRAGTPGFPGAPGAKGTPGRPGMPPGALPVPAPPAPPAAPNAPAAPKAAGKGRTFPTPMSPMAPMPTPGLPWAAGGGKSGDLERRLDQVERKLDSLLWELQNLRRDLSKTPLNAPKAVGPRAAAADPFFAPPTAPAAITPATTEPAAPAKALPAPGSAPGLEPAQP